MSWLRKLPGSVRAASGLEWQVWKKLPLIAVLGTLAPLLVLGVMVVFAESTPSPAQERAMEMAQYLVAAVIVFHWSMVLTVAFGCIIVMIMKGPGYVADAYQVSHSDVPRRTIETPEEAGQRRRLSQNYDPEP